MLTLDVACGNRPRGSVNVDLTRNWNPMRYSKTGLRRGVNWREIPNFIVAEMHHLPFRANVFDIVTSYSALEFSDNPVKAIKEMLRVSKRKVEIYVPHRLARGSKNWRSHFDPAWFIRLFNKLEIFNYKITVRQGRFPHKLLPILLWPYGIDVNIQLTSKARLNSIKLPRG